MAGPPTSAFMQATCFYRGGAAPLGAATTWGLNTPGTLAELPDIADAFGDCHSDVAVATIELAEVRFKLGPVSTGPTYVVPVNQAGTRGGFGGTPNTAILVEKAVNGLSGRLWGRAYWPGLGEDDVDADGDIESTFLGVAQTAFTTLYDALVTLTGSPQVFSTLSSDPRPVAAFAVDSRAATQRRRLRR